MVAALLWVRIEREQELVPGEDRRENRRGGESRTHQRHGDAPEDLPAGIAVDQRGLLDLDRYLGEEAAHDPGDERQVEGGVDQDQGQMAVEQARLLDHQVDRHDEGNRRREAGREDVEREVLVAAKAEAGEAVCGHGAENHGECRAGASDHEAVQKERQHAAPAEHEQGVVEVLPGRLEQPDRRPCEDIGLALQRGRDDDVEREQREARERGRDQVAEVVAQAYEASLAPGPPDVVGTERGHARHVRSPCKRGAARKAGSRWSRGSASARPSLRHSRGRAREIRSCRGTRAGPRCSRQGRPWSS